MSQGITQINMKGKRNLTLCEKSLCNILERKKKGMVFYYYFYECMFKLFFHVLPLEYAVLKLTISSYSGNPTYLPKFLNRSSSGPHKGRADDWADPWMRSKSPSGRKSRPTRRQSYSSGSSYSSSRYIGFVCLDIYLYYIKIRNKS